MSPIRDNQSTPTIVEELKKNLAGVVAALEREISGVRTSRPSPALFENIKVNYYDQSTPIKALGAIGVLPPRTVTIQVWDEGAVAAIAKAIEASSLNVSAQIDGNNIRVNLPELSSERREELLRHVKKMAEEHRIKIRAFRDEANKKSARAFDEGEFGEDQKFKLKEIIQREVDAANEKIEKGVEAKAKEIGE